MRQWVSAVIVTSTLLSAHLVIGACIAVSGSMFLRVAILILFVESVVCRSGRGHCELLVLGEERNEGIDCCTEMGK